MENFGSTTTLLIEQDCPQGVMSMDTVQRFDAREVLAALLPVDLTEA
jgi:hypothetical protein